MGDFPVVRKLAVLARRLLLGRPGQNGLLADSVVAANDKVTQYRVAEMQRAHKFVQGVPCALHVHQHVVRLLHLGDGVGEHSSPQVLVSMNLALAAFDDADVTIHHYAGPFTLIRMDQKHDFVVSQWTSSMVFGRPPARCG